MITEIVKLNNHTGLHARPAAKLGKILKKYHSDLTFIYNDKVIPIKGMVSILGSGITGQSIINIQCDGDDEKEMMNEIRYEFDNGFGDK